MLDVVELVEVRKRYRGVGEVLSGVSLAVSPGSVSVVLGANGSGKSTLLRIAAGCSTASGGVVRGRSSVVGFLPAQFPASSRLSVRTYLRHLAAVHGGGRGAVGDAQAVLEELGFSGALDGAVSELSTGNAQKVGLAQALGARAGLLVLDEPWTALDDAAASALSRRLEAASGEAAVLLADHGGRGQALGSAVVHRLEDGRLEPVDDGEASDDGDGVTGPIDVVASAEMPGTVAVVVRCPATARELISGLPPARGAQCQGRQARVWLEPATADRWMAAALAAGGSVRSVCWPDEPEALR